MRDIEVFIHLYIPAADTLRMWTWWVDEQLGLIKSSKLHEIANINMAITMPRQWVVDVNHSVEFWVLVVDYLTARYPFVKILDMRDINDPNIYEGQTLRFLHKACQERDIDVLYVHSKGYTSNTAHISSWRQILNHYTISEWPKCLKHLEMVDVVGVKDSQSLEYTVSGNFWWSKSEYIRKLPEPLDSTVYQLHPGFQPDGPSYRYAFEHWLGVERPTVHHIVDTRTNHYLDYCFLENLSTNNRAN